MKDKKFLIITSLLILLPTIVGVLLWNQLPEQLPTHWGVDGQADGWSGKAFAVFGVPLIFLAFQWICILVTWYDPEGKGQNQKILTIVLLIFPVLSMVTGAAMYSATTDLELDVGSLIPVLIGLMFLAIGNYLPKCRKNATLGIKLPWTFASEENWNKTHRFGGKVWVVSGILILANTILGWTWLFLAAIFAAILIPTVYSGLLYRKQRREGTAAPLPKQNKTATIISVVISLGVLVLLCFVLFTGNIQVEVDDTTLTVTADRWDDLTVDLAAIDAVEYRESAVEGSREWGFGSLRLLAGLFSNEEFGNYTRYTYTGGGPCIVICSGENVLVLGLGSPEQTRALYEELLTHIGK